MTLWFGPHFEGGIERLVKESILPPLEFSNFEQCIDCINDKYVKQIKKNVKRSAGILEIIHTDICGLFPIASLDGYDSFIIFTDDYSHYGYIYPIKERSKDLDKFKIFNTEVENQHVIKIKIVRSNRGVVLWSSYPIWPNSWTFREAPTEKWHSRPIFHVGRTSVKWSGRKA
jgi:hypothetical protein